jgi:hypothetical protein
MSAFSLHAVDSKHTLVAKAHDSAPKRSAKEEGDELPPAVTTPTLPQRHSVSFSSRSTVHEISRGTIVFEEGATWMVATKTTDRHHVLCRSGVPADELTAPLSREVEAAAYQNTAQQFSPATAVNLGSAAGARRASILKRKAVCQLSMSEVDDSCLEFLFQDGAAKSTPTPGLEQGWIECCTFAASSTASSTAAISSAAAVTAP